jgi:pimeloyl-ACP methyl ester carboxylesterase
MIPRDPARVLVLAHGFPWPDDSRSDGELIQYAQAAVGRWAAFAEAHHAIIVSPAFGGHAFPRYREMSGRSTRPDEFVNALVDEVAGEHLPQFHGRFSLHGHSAGGQFAARYLVTHPQRLEEVVLSAPSTYPAPDPAIPWPNGMGASVMDESGGSPAAGGGTGHVPAVFVPRQEGWLTAASEVSVSVLVGSGDTEPRPAAPGQQGSTRIERATTWVEKMHHFAEASQRTPTIRLVLADGLAHDEAAMAIPAQEILAHRWGS